MASGMVKGDIIRDFAAINGVNQATAKQYVDTVVSLIIEGLNENGKVYLQYLGTFEKKEVPAKKLYNFQTKQLEEVPAHYGVRFIPCESLRKDLYE